MLSCASATDASAPMQDEQQVDHMARECGAVSFFRVCLCFWFSKHVFGGGREVGMRDGFVFCSRLLSGDFLFEPKLVLRVQL